MPLYDTECRVCGNVHIDVFCGIDVHPPCILCNGPTHRVWTSQKSQAIGDDIPGGIVLENVGPNPMKFYSHSELRRYLRQPRQDKNGNTYYLTPFVRHVGVPGTDKSPHTTNWAASITQETLDKAKSLLERVGAAKAPEFPENEFDERYNEPGFADPSVRHFEYAGTTAEALRIAQIIEGD